MSFQMPDVIEHEFDLHGCHRLVVNGEPGPWVGCRAISFWRGYAGLTKYHADDALLNGQILGDSAVFRLDRVESSSIRVRRHDHGGREPCGRECDGRIR